MTTLYQSDVGVIKRIVLKHPKDAFVSDEVIGREWERLNYMGPPDFIRSVEEYDRFIDLLKKFKLDLHFLPNDKSVGLDSIYTRDASIVCKKGMILCHMGKAERYTEPAAQKTKFRTMGIPIRGTITGNGRVEGGDVVWVDEHTLVVGRGYRTNDEGIRQLKKLLGECVKELTVVPLPHWRGPSDVFHLMSIFSPVDHGLALVYEPLMPVPFREALLARDIELIEVPDSEFESMGCNVLAVAPRKCIMLAGNPHTRERLERAGVEVYEFEGQEICIKGGGGPTCLTRPIMRVKHDS